jgi:hypothetical protein
VYWSRIEIEDVPPGDETMTSTTVPLAFGGACAAMEVSLPIAYGTDTPPILTEVAPLKYWPVIETLPIGPAACVTTGAGYS